MHTTGFKSQQIEPFLASIVEELLLESETREDLYLFLLLNEVHQLIGNEWATDVVLNYAFLQGKAIMHRSCYGLLQPRIKDDGSWATAREGSEHWCLADVDRGDLELLEHKLGQLHPRLLVVWCRLGENERGLPWVDHQLVNQTLSQYILKVIEVNYEISIALTYLSRALGTEAVSPCDLSWSWARHARLSCGVPHHPWSCLHRLGPNQRSPQSMDSHSSGSPPHCNLLNDEMPEVTCSGMELTDVNHDTAHVV